jgi:CO dehydrogenase/acetyl-CoA synthase alpha subunit
MMDGCTRGGIPEVSAPETSTYNGSYLLKIWNKNSNNDGNL